MTSPGLGAMPSKPSLGYSPMSATAPTATPSSLSPAYTGMVSPGYTTEGSSNASPRRGYESVGLEASRKRLSRSLGGGGGRASAIEGGIAARLCARTTTRVQMLLQQELEDAVVSKVGFFASILHSWRREAVLQRKSREADEEMRLSKEVLESQLAQLEARLGVAHEKQRQSQQRAQELVLAKWLGGNCKFLTTAVLHEWHTLVSQQREMQKQIQKTGPVISRMMASQDSSLLRGVFQGWSDALREEKHKKSVAAKTQTAMYRWIKGNDAGLLEGVLRAWAGELEEKKTRQMLRAEQDALERKLAQERARCDQLIKNAEDAELQRKDAAQKSIQIVCQKWIIGNDQGLFKEVMSAWGTYVQASKKNEKNKKQVLQILEQELLGKEKGLLTVIVAEWHKMASREVRERKAHNQVAMMLLKDGAQKDQAMITSIFSAWREDAGKSAEAKRRHNKQLAFLGGQCDSALKKEIVEAWRDPVVAKRRRRANERVQSRIMATKIRHLESALLCEVMRELSVVCHKARLERLLQQAQEEKRGLLDEAEQRQFSAKEQAKQVTEMMLKKWTLGYAQGCLSETFGVWATYTIDLKRTSRTKESMKMAVLQSAQGAERGMLELCYKEWFRYASKIRAESRKRKTLMAMFNRKQDGASSDLLHAVFVAWQKRSAAEAHKKAAHDKQMAFLGGNCNKALLKEAIEGWTTVWRHAMQKKRGLNRQSERIHRKMVAMQHDLLVLILREVYAACHTQRLEKHLAAATEAQRTLEERLWIAYAQVDEVTEQLTRELQTKEGLTNKLREAYNHMRGAPLRALATPPAAVTPPVPGYSQYGHANAPVMPARQEDLLPFKGKGVMEFETTADFSSPASDFSRGYPMQGMQPTGSLLSTAASAVNNGFGQRSMPLPQSGAESTAETTLRGGLADMDFSCNWDAAVARLKTNGMIDDDETF
eukprot:TRINITY_DN28284_c0_g2_i2.p1 TRINITY_DN28284_c0_g2~~TRINITY_DN28284_c0_g2_i2.p1  ORF type:complete len:1095 (+),score=249.52 TRINITY_DN28284_c0_g2_i2:468-3287(+)